MKTSRKLMMMAKIKKKSDEKKKPMTVEGAAARPRLDRPMRMKRADGGRTWTGEGDTGQKMRDNAKRAGEGAVLAPILGGIGAALSATRLGKIGSRAIAPGFLGLAAVKGGQAYKEKKEAEELAEKAEGRKRGGKVGK